MRAVCLRLHPSLYFVAWYGINMLLLITKIRSRILVMYALVCSWTSFCLRCLLRFSLLRQWRAICLCQCFFKVSCTLALACTYPYISHSPNVFI
jgi:hypothetical protein